MVFEEESRWYQNIILIDILIIFGTFAFLAISAIIIFFVFPIVVTSINSVQISENDI